MDCPIKMRYYNGRFYANCDLDCEDCLYNLSNYDELLFFDNTNHVYCCGESKVSSASDLAIYLKKKKSPL